MKANKCFAFWVEQDRMPAYAYLEFGPGNEVSLSDEDGVRAIDCSRPDDLESSILVLSEPLKKYLDNFLSHDWHDDVYLILVMGPDRTKWLVADYIAEMSADISIDVVSSTTRPGEEVFHRLYGDRSIVNTDYPTPNEKRRGREAGAVIAEKPKKSSQGKDKGRKASS